MFYLSSFAQQEKYSYEFHDILESTNLYAKQLIQDAADDVSERYYDKHWIVAGAQTSGKGRRGRSWFSPKGNLYTSLILIEGESLNALNAIRHIADLCFVSSISLIETFKKMAYIYQPKLEEYFFLKWPNDVLFQKAKIAGSLLEIVKLKKNNGLIIGMGANILAKLERPNYLTACLHENGILCTAEEFFSVLSHRWAVNFTLWQNGIGKEKIRRKWLSSAAGLGEKIFVKVNFFLEKTTP